MDTAQVRPSILLQRHREEVIAMVGRHHASNARVFGSVARGDDSPSSVIDLLVTFDDDAALLVASGPLLDLEVLLGIRVDVMSDRAQGSIRDLVIDEAVAL